MKPSRKCLRCPTLIYQDNASGLCRRCFNAANAKLPPIPADERVTIDRERQRATFELNALKTKYAAAVQTIERQEGELGWLDDIRKGVSNTFKITSREGTGTSEATPVVLISDWHSEEIVKPASVSGLNEFNPGVCAKRVTTFWQSSLRLIRLLNQDVKIHQVVLALLGDFITNQIHGADNAENNATLPVQAIIDVQDKIIAGIQFFLEHSKYDLVIPCKVGNHSRITLKVRHASEAGHSLESLMYVHLAAYFRGEKRVKFVIEDGYHTYMNVYDQTIRLHHGHNIQYQGGIGGLFIPAFKAVSQWNKARHADLDVFGHFHQSKDGRAFVCNGSLIGYNAFAVAIKADYEPPMQTLLLIDKKRGRTCTWPIMLEASRA
jgi:hypothetical protein